MLIETYTLTWEGIEIELTYEPRKWNVIAHLEVRSTNPDRAPLPITETGYRSHFFPCGTIEAHDGALIEQVTAWLDEAATSKEWQKYLEDARIPLFSFAAFTHLVQHIHIGAFVGLCCILALLKCSYACLIFGGGILLLLAQGRKSIRDDLGGLPMGFLNRASQQCGPAHDPHGRLRAMCRPRQPNIRG